LGGDDLDLWRDWDAGRTSRIVQLSKQPAWPHLTADTFVRCERQATCDEPY